jgi:predicted ATPase
VGAEAAPPPPAEAVPDPGAGTLPRPLTRLIGREEELERVAARLRAARLVTITGAGGVGKTRLALAVADRVADAFPDGTWLIDLGAQSDPALVPKAIATTLTLDVRSGAFRQSVLLWLAKRRGLLIFDSCEHLLDAAAAMAEAILQHCPAVTILVTSREPLRAEGEILHRLASLATAAPEQAVPPEALPAWPAAALFLDRARAVLGDFIPGEEDAAAVMAICRRLDGIPLAIELAAPMLQALTPAQLRDRLEQRFALLASGRRTALPRQQTLKATIDWSFELLAPAELGLLLPLSVFPGSWTAEAATCVAGQALGEDETCRLIAGLVDKSLLLADLSGLQPRYRMLGATRFYAGERLPASALAEGQARLARWLARACARAEADWPTMPDAEWIALYGAEQDNLRAGLAWAFGATGDATIGIALASVTEQIWGEFKSTGELMAWFDLALSRVTDATPPDQAGRLWLGRCGWLAIGDRQALPAAGRAVALFRRAADPLGLGRALSHQALQHLAAGTADAAVPLLAEADRLLGGLPESKAHLSLLRVQALLESRRGRPELARPTLQAALTMAQRLHAQRDAALVQGDIAELHFATGDPDAAIATAEAALAALGPAKARSAWVQHIHGALASYLLAKGDIAAARGLAADRLYAARIMGMPREVAANVERAGLIAAIEGDAAVAGRLLGYGQAHHAGRPALRSPGSQAVFETLVGRLRDRLPEAELRRLAGEGARLTEEEASAEAAKA